MDATTASAGNPPGGRVTARNRSMFIWLVRGFSDVPGALITEMQPNVVPLVTQNKFRPNKNAPAGSVRVTRFLCRLPDIVDLHQCEPSATREDFAWHERLTK